METTTITDTFVEDQIKSAIKTYNDELNQYQNHPDDMTYSLVFDKARDYITGFITAMMFVDAISTSKFTEIIYNVVDKKEVVW